MVYVIDINQFYRDEVQLGRCLRGHEKGLLIIIWVSSQTYEDYKLPPSKLRVRQS